MRLVALQSLICTAPANLLGSFAPPGVTVSSAPTTALCDTGPRALASSGSSSHARLPLQSPSPLHSSTALASSVRLPWGFCLHHDISSWSPLFDKIPSPCLCSVLSVSHALGGFLLQAPCSLISFCSHVRDSLFRGCFPLPSQYNSSPYCALVSLDDFRLQPSCPNCPAPAAPTSGLCSGQRFVAPSRWFRPAHHSIPS